MRHEATKILEVALYVKGEDLNPSDVTCALAVVPTISHVKGGVKSHSKSIIAKNGLWVLKSGITTTDVDDHIEEILEIIEKSEIQLDKLNGVTDAFIYIYIAENDSEGKRVTVELRLRCDIMRRLVNLGLGVDFVF